MSMTEHNRSSILIQLLLLFFGALLAFLLFFFVNAIHAEVMPSYERSQPITTNLNAPTSVALDAYENLYVTDVVNNRLIIYDQTGDYSRMLQGLNKPISVAADSSGRIFVGNKGRKNVEVYDSGLNLLLKLGGGDGEFTHPDSIAIDHQGKIYVVDGKADKIKVYNADGSLSFSFGTSGSGNGQFHFPTAIAIDNSAEEIIISDLQIVQDWSGPYEGARIQVFGMNGSFKRSFGVFGLGDGMLFRPMGVAVDKNHRVYVSDSYQHVVQAFDSNGAFLGTVYDLDNPMRTPLGIAIGDSNRLFTTSLIASRVDVYNITSGTNADISAVPGSHNFGSVTDGGDSSARLFTVYNIGGSDLVIGTISIAGANASEFLVQSDNCSGQTVTPSGTCSVEIMFSPDTEGVKNADISFPSNDPDSPVLAVQLSGAGLNAPPNANAGGPYSGVAGQAITLDGSGSSDLDGNIVLYEWDIDNDGVYDYSSASPAQDHPFTEGTYTIKLRVEDNSGQTDEATATAIISIADSQPSAAFSASLTSGTAPLTVDFINQSTGGDGSLTYQWDFDNDGTVDSDEVNPSCSYNAAGTYSVKLTVTDADSDVDILTKTDYISVACQFVRIHGAATCYTSIQDAYDDASVSYEDTIESGMYLFTEDLNFDMDKTVTLRGGYDSNFSSVVGNTVVRGNITITGGNVTLENIELQ